MRKFKGEEKLFGSKSYKRTARDVIDERDGGYGSLHDFQGGRNIKIRWRNDWNGPFEDDMVFLLDIGGRLSDKGNGAKTTIALSKEEVLRWLRYV